ncbi:hypothetical protein [Streptomyces sp. NPDC096324]|uniref:hypothetical protein n=1 Tax=Streptomyces sp. NPDC096324 TaxID=3366085 RepID=UPI00381E15B6
MSDAPSNDLIALEQASMDAHARLLELQERYGSPSAGDGWSEEQHAEYGQLWRAWREAALKFHAALPGGSDRYAEEMRVKAAVRHPATEAA